MHVVFAGGAATDELLTAAGFKRDFGEAHLDGRARNV
jgi:hypothetical protein